MDYGAHHIVGGRPRIMTASSSDRTMNSSSWVYTYLVEEEDRLGQKGYLCWLLKPIGDKMFDGP